MVEAESKAIAHLRDQVSEIQRIMTAQAEHARDENGRVWVAMNKTHDELLDQIVALKQRLDALENRRPLRWLRRIGL